MKDKLLNLAAFLWLPFILLVVCSVAVGLITLLVWAAQYSGSHP